ncbi:DUF397 domain-containing protein [Yinghuangia sp. YIM S09857]|uniref:DUF397 domain-containing protein n=1 Tax=Yinghuangia sp. YIM S09857 TaxID=3436929 RepID=UPI003F539467
MSGDSQTPARITWTKSSHSGTSGGECVEVATSSASPTTRVRDSKAAGGPILGFAATDWATFIGATKARVR